MNLRSQRVQIRELDLNQEHGGGYVTCIATRFMGIYKFGDNKIHEKIAIKYNQCYLPPKLIG